jgi:hypothetical protein
MFPEEKRMSARVRFSDGEEPEAQLELEPELANRLFQAPVVDPELLGPYAVQTFWKLSNAVLGIRILRIRLFLGLPDPDPLVRGPDPSLFS